MKHSCGRRIIFRYNLSPFIGIYKNQLSNKPISKKKDKPTKHNNKSIPKFNYNYKSSISTHNFFSIIFQIPKSNNHRSFITLCSGPPFPPNNIKVFPSISFEDIPIRGLKEVHISRVIKRIVQKRVIIVLFFY